MAKNTRRDFFEDLLPFATPDKFVRNNIRRQNVLMAIYISFFILLVECAIFAWSITYFQFGSGCDGRCGLYPNQIAYLAVILFCSVCQVILRRTKKTVNEKPRVPRVTTNLFCVAVLTFGLYVSVKDAAHGIFPLTFLTIYMTIFGVLLIKPAVHMALSIGLFAAFVGLIYFSAGISLENTVNYLIFFVFVVLMGLINFSVAIHRYEAMEDLRDANRILEEMSYFDELTTAKNRNSWRKDTPGFIGRDLCYMVCDIDNFKTFNDKYGHNIGDVVLKSVAKALIQEFGRESVYRMGGDEFVIVSREALESAGKKFNTIQTLLRGACPPGLEDVITLSGGAAFARAKNEDAIKKCIDFADKMLYGVKNSGKARLGFCKV